MAEIEQGFTPGPWMVQRFDDGFVNVVNQSGSVVVAVPGEPAFDPTPIEANARLIAAAPDLLAAAIEVLEGLNARIDAAGSTVPVFSGIAALHEAIAKATLPPEGGVTRT